MWFQYGGTLLDIMPTKQPIILVIACYLYVFILLIMYFCFDECGNIWVLYSFLLMYY